MGERQLVLVAMAVAQGGRLIVLDEPTVHLDLRHQVEVLSLLVRLSAAGLTVVAVLHDLPMAAQFFPRLVLLDEGRLVADGTPAMVLTPGASARSTRSIRASCRRWPESSVRTRPRARLPSFSASCYSR